jgi:hypothetical protein
MTHVCFRHTLHPAPSVCPEPLHHPVEGFSHTPTKENHEPVNLLLLIFGPIINQLTRIEQKVDTLMAQVSIAQEDLDTFAADIQESVDLVAQEIQNLVDSADNPLTEADVTALQAAVDSLKALEPPHADNTLPEPEEA